MSDVVKLAIGMKVMVTLNLQTEIDFSNGTRGVVEDAVHVCRIQCSTLLFKLSNAHMQLIVLAEDRVYMYVG